ncbi:helix-turn-helix domain-containing protein [Nonomuraea mangrovi]|uniref:Helix-turn-helix domain-containing protein n=1 Tax=Nonomuraea mangrovi TaxID=2316207 RepID=A0ABW4TIF3_9ACTN
MSESGLPPARRLWERVESERNNRGWTTVELQERSGVDRSTVSRLKTSKRSPLPETVNKLADTLGIPRQEALALAGLVGAPNVRSPEDAITAPQSVVSIVNVEGDADTDELLARLSPRRRRLLEQFRESERERLARIAESVARETEEANRRFAELVRSEAEETDLS